MSELTYVTVAQVGSIAEGTGRAFAIHGRVIAVFKDHERYFAIDDVCPHMGASLAEGYVEEGVVACPWHAWRFRVCDGTWCDNPKLKIDSFPVRVVGDQIQVGLAIAPSAACPPPPNPSVPPPVEDRDLSSSAE
jgi:nitrite reductase (NADH) small subunit/3-phenylpropionate/trans-cinnamate dioxygenase ferredoxin subunit